ncbi:MAG: glutathione S-transferase [Burkholderiaceae bacterium]
MTSLPVLYSFRRCPFAMRARLAIAASDQVCELREISLRDKPAALLKASPKATVPVLVDIDGRVIDQSLDIMLWALQRNDPGAWLAPTLRDLGSMLALVAECDGDFKYHLDRYKYPERYDEPNADEHRGRAADWLDGLNDTLHDSPFLFGDHAALADMAIAPFVRQFAHTDSGWFQSQPWTNLHAWLNRWLASELFAQVMQKYPLWELETAGVRFPS